MTVCNILFTDHAVTIYSDTLVYLGDDPVQLCRRKVEFADSFAWGTRGSVVLGARLDAILVNAGDLDEAGDAARDWLASLTAEDLARHGCTNGQQVIMAGWSRAARDLVALDLHRCMDGSMTEKRLDRGVYLHPTVRAAAGPVLPKALSDAQMIAVAHAQKRFDEETASGMCVGGVLWRHVVTRDGVTESIADLYADYDDHARRFGDPCAAEVAQWRAASLRVAA